MKLVEIYYGPKTDAAYRRGNLYPYYLAEMLDCWNRSGRSKRLRKLTGLRVNTIATQPISGRAIWCISYGSQGVVEEWL